MLVVPALAYFAYAFVTGNPTQRVNKLFSMMSKGMAGGEDVSAFDKVPLRRPCYLPPCPPTARVHQHGRPVGAGWRGVPVQIFTTVKGNDQHNAYDGDVANKFYNLASEFYEYGWGDSFHFGYRKQGEPHSAAIANSQNFVAQKLQVSQPRDHTTDTHTHTEDTHTLVHV